MYLPNQFKSEDISHALTLMRENPLASLISTDDSGLPFITHVPLYAEQTEDAESGLVLWGHVAKGNPHWRFLQARPRAAVAFLGPHAYMSPAVYPDLARVPTWSYVAVHCTVEARLIDDPVEKDALLKKLIGDHEPAYAEQWRGLDESFTEKMLAAIIGFELRVSSWQCKIKVNQHRPESHVAMSDMLARGNDNERGVAQWMARLGLPKRGVMLQE